MSSFFYNLGRKAGRSLVKGKWIYQSLFGSEAEAIQAEYIIGCELSHRMKRQVKLVEGPFLQQLIQTIGEQLVDKLPNKQRRFRFHIFVSSEVNAFALPGGFVFITQSLINLTQQDKDEIAFIIAHEIGHIIAGHPFRRILANSSVTVITNLMKTGGMLGHLAKQLLSNFLRTNYSRENELEADEFAVRLMSRAGFAPQAAKTILEKLAGNSIKSSRFFSYFSTHPAFGERIKNIALQVD